MTRTHDGHLSVSAGATVAKAKRAFGFRRDALLGIARRGDGRRSLHRHHWSAPVDHTRTYVSLRITQRKCPCNRTGSRLKLKVEQIVLNLVGPNELAAIALYATSQITILVASTDGWGHAEQPSDAGCSLALRHSCNGDELQCDPHALGRAATLPAGARRTDLDQFLQLGAIR